MTGRQFPLNKRFWHFIALTMSMIMLYSVLLVAFHHHDDEQDHDDDCPICAVTHHVTAVVAFTPPVSISLPFSILTLFILLPLPIVTVCCRFSPQTRAPPV
jgi:hypothetical protein